MGWNTKMTSVVPIAIFVGHFAPGWKAGGPVRTVLEMVQTAPPTIQPIVITSDRDLGERHPYPDFTGRVNGAFGADVIYTNWGNIRSVTYTLAAIVKDRPKLLIANSFFSPISGLLPVILSTFGVAGGRLAIGPRGEFSTGALGLKSRRKRTYLRMIRCLPALKRASWLATSPRERKDILHIFPQANIVIIPDSRGTEPARTSLPASPSVRFVFLGRISPMKNLTGALKALADTPPSLYAEFHIYGAIEDERYWLECSELIRQMPSNITVIYRGEVRPEDAPSIFARYDAFIFPTLGENFGHVIHEALSHGCPVLLADTTPWSELILKGGGRLCSTPTELRSAIVEYCEADQAERTALKVLALDSYKEWRSVQTANPPLATIASHVGLA